VAGWLRLLRLRPRRGLAAGRWAVRVRQLPGAHLDDGGHDLRPDAHAADGMVHRLLVVRLRQGRHLRAEPAAVIGELLRRTSNVEKRLSLSLTHTRALRPCTVSPTKPSRPHVLANRRVGIVHGRFATTPRAMRAPPGLTGSDTQEAA